MGNPYKDVMQAEVARRMALSGLSRRERIEEDLGQEWFTVKQAAEELGLHEKTVRNHIHEGKLKASRPSPRKTRIYYTDLAEYMDKNVG